MGTGARERDRDHARHRDRDRDRARDRDRDRARIGPIDAELADMIDHMIATLTKVVR